MGQSICEKCEKPASSLYLEEMKWVCKHCRSFDEPSLYFKEVGVENPYDKKGSTAHVRDIKNRRLDTKTNRMFYYEAPKSYFFPKGK